LPEPSETTWQSDESTRENFSNQQAGKNWLIERWRERVDEKEEKVAMDILSRFEIDAYRHGSYLPSDDLWIGDEE
jgi:hypothetical protein